MKKNVFCAGALALWALLFCTFFSLRVEDMMTPQVISTRPGRMPNSTKEALNISCLFPDGQGGGRLYGLYEGTGWEDGQRAVLTSPDLYEVDLARGVLYILGGEFISCAGKAPLVGETVRKIESGDPVSDHWLALCPGGTGRQKPLSNGAELEAQTENLLLVSVPDGFSPFMENRAKFRLFTTTVFDEGPETLYSINDVESFLSQLTLAAGLGALVLFVLILWGGSCRLLRRPKRNKKPLIANGVLYLLSIAAQPLLLSKLSLPQSLLPPQVISDLSHYQAEFGSIFEALSTLSEEGSETARAVLSHAYALPWFCGAILLLGAAAGVFLLILEKSAVTPRGRHHRPVK